jgi:hypothetical protein
MAPPTKPMLLSLACDTWVVVCCMGLSGGDWSGSIEVVSIDACLCGLWSFGS